ncbi:MAG TPA: stage II sporulation protein M [Methanoregulaceae archaeon]|jgi:stage II sporulation protein M|nr:stage II sporulation protein M [Methanoregulaceae archaeon]HOP67246.1 stage II sporulation protein M [Methanoregulaceae archaeon]HPJ74625.1 stage II sporulation protein M [Methanoregulaceae archaeon]HPQ75997.1 stage II sporulation protein M [Methanoregulaceae archaeon]HRX33017.1 stage II sporulation protein M [Methanoregulaceae archaeon]
MSDMRDPLVVTAALFALSLAAGVLVSVAEPAFGTQMVEFFRDAVIGEIMTDSSLLLAGKLFLNNIQACIFMFLGGATFGLVTIFIIGTNGFVIGSILEVVRQESSLLYVAAAIVPHGIFEIPAFIISGALGLSLARSLYTEWTGAGDAGGDAAVLGRRFVAVVLPLIAIAAITEAFITPWIIQFVA